MVSFLCYSHLNIEPNNFSRKRWYCEVIHECLVIGTKAFMKSFPKFAYFSSYLQKKKKNAWKRYDAILPEPEKLQSLLGQF